MWCVTSSNYSFVGDVVAGMALEDMEDMELLSGSLKYYVSKYRPY